MSIENKCQQLVDQVNQAIKKSYASENPEEKREEFFCAVKKLNELKESIREFPGGYITGLLKFEGTLEEIEDEYYEKGIFKKDLFSGWVYQTVFRLETPLTSLLNHGEFKESIVELEAVTSNDKHGGWIQKTRSFREMGLDVDEVKNTFIASIVGPISPDGGLFLDYLIELRKIVESAMEIAIKKELLEDALSKQQYYGFNMMLGGKKQIIKILFKSVEAM